MHPYFTNPVHYILDQDGIELYSGTKQNECSRIAAEKGFQVIPGKGHAPGCLRETVKVYSKPDQFYYYHPKC